MRPGSRLLILSLGVAAFVTASGLVARSAPSESGRVLGAAGTAHRYLVVASVLPSGRQIVEILGPTGRVERVVAAPSHPGSFSAQWSPNRSLIAWATTSGVTVERADGRGKRLLVPTIPGCKIICQSMMTFGWSPDGQKLVVGGAGKQTNLLLVVDLKTGRSTKIAPVRAFTQYRVVGWSPDGRSIAYVRTSGNPGTASCCRLDLMVAKADGSGARSIFSFKEAIHDGPAASWSTDSRSIAFTSDGRDPHDPRFAVVDVATGKVTPIDGFNPYDQVLAWSPDSHRLAVAQVTGPIVTLAATGGDVQSLGTTGDEVVWGRKGDVIIVHGAKSRDVFQSRDGQAAAELLFHMPKNIAIGTIDPT